MTVAIHAYIVAWLNTIMAQEQNPCYVQQGDRALHSFPKAELPWDALLVRGYGGEHSTGQRDRWW